MRTVHVAQVSESSRPAFRRSLLSASLRWRAEACSCPPFKVWESAAEGRPLSCGGSGGAGPGEGEGRTSTGRGSPGQKGPGMVFRRAKRAARSQPG